MTIKQLGGVFGRNPTFNDVTIEGTLTFDGDIDITSDLTIEDNLYVLGQVGIATQDPDQPLHIADNAAAIIRLERNDTTIATGNKIGSIEFEHQESGQEGVCAEFMVEAATGTGHGDFVFENGRAGVLTETMRIDYLGNVGIGTSTPTAKLNVRDGNLTVARDGSDTQIRAVGFGAASLDAVISLSGTASNNAAADSEIRAIGGSGTGGILTFLTDTSGGVMTERVRIDSSGNVGIRNTNPSETMHIVNGSDRSVILRVDGADSTTEYIALGVESGLSTVTAGGVGSTSNALAFSTASSGAEAEHARLDSSGTFLVSKTADDNTTNGLVVKSNGLTKIVRTSGTANVNTVLQLNRLSTDGDILRLQKDGSDVGDIGSFSGFPYMYGGTGFLLSSTALRPADSDGSNSDNDTDLGSSSARFKDIYATNGTINTSDRNEKQDIELLSDAEQRVAVAAKGLLRKFRWKSAAEEKGDDARIHFGIIAQDLQDAFTAEGLDAGRYGMFINSTWTDEETGEERSRMGVRYSELLAFIIAAI